MYMENIFNYFNLDLSLVTGRLVLIAVILILITLLQTLATRPVVEINLPPGPTGLPFVGYLPFLGKEPHKKFWDMRKKYGNIIRVQLGTKFFVVLNDYDVAKEVLSHPAALNRSPFIFTGIGSGGLLADNGDKWREQRNYVLSTFHGFEKDLWEDFIMEEIETFMENIKKLDGKPTDISAILSHSLISNIVILLTGHRLTESDKIQLCAEFSDLAFTFTSPVFTAVPGLRKLCEIFKIAGYDRFLKVSRNFAQFMIDQINRHKTKTEYMKEENFINSYLEKLSEMSGSKGIKKHYFSETALQGHLAALFLGGSDTIFSSLTWLFRIMSQHKDIEQRVYQEIMGAFGIDKRCRYDERFNIPYTFAVIMEVQRYGRIVPLSGTRIASENIPVQGYVIPKGTEITANMWAIHNNPANWNEPDKFRPERFLSADGTQLFEPSINYMPFSVGRRNCPGKIIALMEILFYFTETVKYFEICTPPGVKPQFEIVNGFVSHLVPQALCFRKRRN